MRSTGSTTRVARRRFMAGVAAATVGLRAPAILAQSKRPLRIGLINSFSKTYAALGENNADGMDLYFEKLGGTVAGRRIELIKEDCESNPQFGLQKLRKLVESDQVDVVMGPQPSNVAMAMVDYVKTNKVFWICSAAGATALTWNRIPYMFRTSLSGWQYSFASSKWFYEKIAPEAVVIASDYAGGHDSIDEFVRVYPGKIVKSIYPPIGVNDFSAYLTDIASLQPKGVYAFFAGTDATRFVKQYAEYGLKDRIKLCSPGFMVDNDTLPAQGEAALGIINTLHYADTLDTPANRAFVAAYRAKHNAYPSVYAEYGYVAAAVLARAVEAVDGDTSDKDKLAAAVAAVQFDAPRGPFRIDPVTHNPIQNIYVREVAEVDGRLTNKVIATVENVRDPGVKA